MTDLQAAIETVYKSCDYKVVYATLAEAEDAYHRTPPRKQRPGSLLPYWCKKHGGFHLGHFDWLGPIAYHGWGADVYAKVNAYARVRRRKAHRDALGEGKGD